MNKVAIIILLLVGGILNAMSQSLSNAEINELVMKAFSLQQQNNYKEALVALQEVAEVTKSKRTTEEWDTYYKSQAMVCSCLCVTKQYEECYNLAKELLRDSLPENEKKDIAYYYSFGGYVYGLDIMHKGKNRDYAKARTIFEEILPYSDGDMKKKIASKIPVAWYFEACGHMTTQNYEKALTFMEKARSGYRQLGKCEEEIQVLLQIVTIKENLCNLSGAMSVCKEARDLASMNHRDLQYMECLNALSSLYSKLGDTGGEQAVASERDSLMEAVDTPDMAFNYYISRGDEAKNFNQYTLAEQYYKKADNTINNSDKITAKKSICYSRLLHLYRSLKRYDEALKYAKLSVSEFHKTFNQNESSYYLPYNDLVDLYRLKGDSIKAFECIDSLSLMMRYTTEPREVHFFYTTRGQLYAHYKNYAAALADYEEADRLLSTKYDEKESNRLILLALLGGMEHKLGHYEKSERYYGKYARYIKDIYGENHWDYIKALNYLANAEGFAGHIDEGCRDYSESVRKMKILTSKELPYLSYAEKEAFWNPISQLLTNMTPFAIKAKECQTEFTRSCYDALLLSKAFLLESERSIYDLLKNNGTSEDLHDYSEISGIQNRIKELSKNYNANSDSIITLTQRMQTLDKSLKSRCRTYGDITGFMDIDYESVKGNLKESDILIDFTDYVSMSKDRKYAAYIINKEQENPLLVPLFAESSIDSMDVTRPDQYYDPQYCPNLIDYVWKPFADKIAEHSTVYYVPSHFLFQIALESIPMKDGSLLGEHYNFVRLSSARELGRHNDHIEFANNEKSAVLYGGLQYDLKPEVMAQEAKKYELPPLLAMRGDIARGDSVYRELRESRAEIENISKNLKRDHVQVTPYMGINGTEESFINLNGKAPDILHFSTHGFYYTPDDAQKFEYLRGYKDAMSLSGLVMSGGNAAWLGHEVPKGVLSGILTANNIAMVDLLHTQLVVLSACQTGQGEATSEGLFGLQRAFKKAGAKTMVMTLWSVSDKVTREFMEYFYENLTSGKDKWNKRTAFTKAKQQIKDKYKKPYYWAAYILLD